MASHATPRGGRGKLDRIPHDIRDQVNLRLFNNEHRGKLLAWLNAIPAVQAVLEAEFGGEPVKQQNLSDYFKHGGYVQWLSDRERIESTKSLARFAMHLAQAAGTNLTDGAAAIAAGRMLPLIEAAQEADLLKAAGAISSLRDAEAKSMRARTDQERLGLQRRTVALEEQKFRRTTAELFLRWYADQRAKEIADSPAASDEKINKLGQLIFGEDWS